MSQRSDEAYVLGTHELGEADLIVTLLAEHDGRVRGVAPFARKSRRRFGGALEPLTRVKASWSVKEGRELHRIESLETARSYASMQSEPALQAACAVLSELAAALCREGEGDPHGFRLLGAVLEALEGGLDPWEAVRYFEFWMLRLHGLLPDLSSCAACGKAFQENERTWASAGEGIRCSPCARQSGRAGRALTREDRSFLSAAATLPPARMGSHSQAVRPGGVLEELLRGTIESFVERRFRTYRHLTTTTRTHPGEGQGPER